MSRSLLHDWEHDIVKYSINVGEMMKVAKDIYDTAYARGKAKAQEKTGRHFDQITEVLEQLKGE